MKTRIAVDTGGTFTDFALLDEHGLRVHKVRSTPDDPARAILEGIRELVGDRVVQEVIHGSTVATNALLERKGARIAFVTTAGFEDILEIGRQTRAELYRLSGEPRRPLVESGFVFGACERVGAGGEVVVALPDEEMRRVVKAVQRAQPEAVAVCLLHSYVCPAHEARLAAALRAAGFLVSASHEILPEYREFERASTTAVNAYVSPVMSRYLGKLEDGLGGVPLRIMQSSGGFISAEEAKREAVRTVLSGPAGGAVGALAVAQAAGFSRVIAFDMGGTSTDVSLLDGALPATAESVIGDWPVRIPSLDIHTVGAGGGSIAFVDAGGGLRVGPRSAGAVPGPACYGVGDELTVTDANLLLGRLDAESFLGGRMRLDVERARGIAERMAAGMKLSVAELALGIVRIANSNIERALRVVSVQRGYDPRDFALLAFGGAGGMHACELAEALDMETVLVPEHAGILSALGMLLADYRKAYSRALLREVDAVPIQELERLFAAMLEQARADLAEAGFADSTMRMERALDVRYVGQSYELTVPFAEGYRSRFDEMHAERYGYCDQSRGCEVVTLRVKATGVTEKPVLPRSEVVQVVKQGPAILAGTQATTVVPAGWSFHKDGSGTVVLTRSTAR